MAILDAIIDTFSRITEEEDALARMTPTEAPQPWAHLLGVDVAAAYAAERTQRRAAERAAVHVATVIAQRSESWWHDVGTELARVCADFSRGAGISPIVVSNGVTRVVRIGDERVVAFRLLDDAVLVTRREPGRAATVYRTLASSGDEITPSPSELVRAELEPVFQVTLAQSSFPSYPWPPDEAPTTGEAR